MAYTKKDSTVLMSKIIENRWTYFIKYINLQTLFFCKFY